MSIKATSNRSLVFPPEILNLIIANLDLKGMTYLELAQLWIAAPFVPGQFQEEIPKVFAKYLLPELTLEYNLDERCVEDLEYHLRFAGLKDYLMPTSSRKYLDDSIYHGEGLLNMSLCFGTFSKDGSRAIYKSDRTMSYFTGAVFPYPAPSEAPPSKGVKFMERCFFKGLRYFEQRDSKYPIHITHLRGVFNDTGLPGFKVDVDRQEIEFDWQELFSRLFKEEMSAAAVELDAIEASFIEKGSEEPQEVKRKVIRHNRFADMFNTKLDGACRHLPAVTLARNDALEMYDDGYARLTLWARERLARLGADGVTQADGDGWWWSRIRS